MSTNTKPNTSPNNKTEQQSYSHQQHLHRIEHDVNQFYQNKLSLQEQLTVSERLLVEANRLYIKITDQINGYHIGTEPYATTGNKKEISDGNNK